LNNKNKPRFLTRIIDFLSPKVAALLFVNSQIGAFAFAMFRQIGSHVGAAVHFFGGSSLLSESVHMYMYIFKTEQRNKRVREKSDIIFVLERPKLVPRPARSYEETPCCFSIRSSCSIADSGGFNFLIALKEKQP